MRETIDPKDVQPIKHPSFHAVTRPEKVAYRMADTGESLTFAELDAASNRVAHVLRDAGLVPGDHVALLVENSLEFFEICWGAQRSGIYYTTISTHLKTAEILYILNDCGARVFFASAALLGPLAEKRRRHAAEAKSGPGSCAARPAPR